jgi:DNA polymerase III subunit alpha, Gram-positive type
MMELFNDKEFIALEKEYKFLSRARESVASKHGGLDKLTYVIFDLETTGLESLRDEIIEIGAIKIENREVKDVFNKLVKPEKLVSSHITELTGISQEMLENEPPIKPVLAQFMEFIGDNILIAHNAEFDSGFIKTQLKKNFNKDLTNTTICTLHISRDVLPNLDNHKLHTIANYYNLNVVNRHRAIGDVELTLQIWLRFLDKLKEKNILDRKGLEEYAQKLAGIAVQKRS